MNFHRNNARQLLLLISCFLYMSSINAQDSTILKRLKELSNKIDTLAKYNKDESQVVGSLTLQKLPVSHYYFNPADGFTYEANTTLKINRISFLLKDGYMVDVHVYSDKKTFTNKRAPIALSARRLEKIYDYLENIDDPREQVIFGELVIHDSLNSYIPEDGLYELTTEKDHLTLVRQVGVNTVIDFRLYTDALGLLGAESNGLVQTDARIKQIIHQGNIANHGTFFFHYFKANFNAGKFDSKKRFVDSATLSRTGLMQKAYFNAEIAVNFLETWVNYKSLSSFYIDFGTGVSSTKLAGLKDTSSVLSNNFFIESGFNFRTSANIGVDTYLRLIDNFSPATPENDGSKSIIFMKIGGEIYYSPIKEKSNRIFARFNYTMSTHQSDKKNSYIQVQFGYSVLLSNLLGKKS